MTIAERIGREAMKQRDEWKARAEAAEAQCAAMRQALDEAQSILEAPTRECDQPRIEQCVYAIRAALRSDAGAALLVERDRLKQELAQRVGMHDVDGKALMRATAERDRLREAVEFAVHQKGNLNPERYVECVSAKARSALGQP